MTTLHIEVGNRAQLREDALQFVRAEAPNEPDEPDEPGKPADDGKTTDPEKSTNPEKTTDSGDYVVLQFGSYDDLVENLTPLRLALLREIAEHYPESMRDAARLVDRDVSDVHADLKRLETLGILDLEPGGPAGAMRPVVPFDRIQVNADFPLTADVDDTPASA